jgi:hypothetical protein
VLIFAPGKGVIIIDNLLEDSGEWSIASGLQGIKFPCIINSRYRDIDFDDVIELDYLGEPDCLSLYENDCLKYLPICCLILAKRQAK